MKKVAYSNLKGYFASQGIKYKDVAKKLDVNVETFSRKINRNRSDFTMAEVIVLCKEYGLDANEFFLE